MPLSGLVVFVWRTFWLSALVVVKTFSVVYGAWFSAEMVQCLVLAGVASEMAISHVSRHCDRRRNPEPVSMLPDVIQPGDYLRDTGGH